MLAIGILQAATRNDDVGRKPMASLREYDMRQKATASNAKAVGT